MNTCEGKAWFSQALLQHYVVAGPIPEGATLDEAQQIMTAYYMGAPDMAPDKWRSFVEAHMDKATIEERDAESDDAGEFDGWDDWSEVKPEEEVG